LRAVGPPDYHQPVHVAFEVIHGRIPGRIRYRSARIVRDPQLASRLEVALRGVAGVRDARASAVTGTILVVYEPSGERDFFESVLADALGTQDGPTRPSRRRPSRSTRAAVLLLRTGLRVAQARAPEHPRIAHAAKRASAHARAAFSVIAQVSNASTSSSVSGALARLREEPPWRSRKTPATTSIAPAPAQESLAWHSMEIEQVCEALGVADARGLTSVSAAARLLSEGSNALTPAERRSELRILLDQLTSTPVMMLAGSAALSIATGGIGDAIAIIVVIGVNAAIGYVIESGAERTIAALSVAPPAVVPTRRDGSTHRVPSEQLVRGDVLVLQAGVVMPADARLFETEELTVDESSLTGESVPVLKHSAALALGSVPLAERKSMVYRGTLVTGGSALGLVVATGDATEIGRIQTLASNVEARQTPMQQQLDRLGRQLAMGAGAACAATLGMGLLRGQRALPMLRTAVSLAVAAVPEGLPTVAITTLALGLSRMREKRVIVRQLSAVETLGAVQVVCFDKTGTLTVNRMTVVTVQAGLRVLQVRAGTLRDETGQAVSPESADLRWLLRIAVLCNEVEVEQERGVVVLRGSPTESALVQLALDAGLDVAALRALNPCLRVQRRAQTRNYMSTLHRANGGRLVAVKGRPSEVLALCSHHLVGGERRVLSEGERAHIETDNERMAGQALRVLGVAFLDHAAPDHSELPAELVWLGLIGMEDPPRPGVPDVIKRFRRAGVRTVMITGDQSATAQAVGRQTGLSDNGHLEIVDSTRLDQIEPAVLSALADRAHIFSRVSPAHKLQIVQALQQAGHVVAMTGDGVNDGPALKAADIGIAMGGGGPSAARAVADIVLEDDELATLIVAIEQGRTIYEDIRKAVHFILATNLGEIIYTLVCTAGMGTPLTPMQLLWINLLTDVFPELALAVEPPESDVLARPPRDPKRPMFTHAELGRIGAEGTIITFGALGAYAWGASRYGAGPRAGTLGFTALTLAQLLHAVSARSETHTIFDRTRLAKSRYMPLAVGGTVAMQVAANLLPPLRAMLGTVPLGLGDWGAVVTAATIPFFINEAVKLTLRPPPVRTDVWDAGLTPALTAEAE
jgi:P-type Ca2+ transporter type 2C